MNKTFLSVGLALAAFTASAQTTNLPGIPIFGAPPIPVANAGNFVLSNNVAPAAVPDVTGVYNSLQPVWSNFVDGVLFQPRFGTNTSLRLNKISGYRANYTPDQWGINLTNGLTLPLSSALSNVTVVAMVKDPPPWINFGSVVWSLSDTNNKDSITAGDASGGEWVVQETYHLQQWLGANNGSFSNLFVPLWMFQYQYNEMVGMYQQPMILAWQRDMNGNWRMYQDTVQGKMSLSNPTSVYASPTNATDPLKLFTLGYDAVTNSPGFLPARTNLNFASVFIFSTTNYSAVQAGYKAALWALNTHSAEFCFGDSRIAPQGNSVIQDPFWYYSKRLDPSVYHRNYAEGGSQGDNFLNFFLANGGLAMFTNLPTDKITDDKVTYEFGYNDAYLGGFSSATMFQTATNSLLQLAAAGAKIRFMDVFQEATNGSFVPYSLATETNIFNYGLMIRTNMTLPIAEYVPLRDSIPQSLIQTNAGNSSDGTHFDRNPLANQFIGDSMWSHAVRTFTNTAVTPL